jgi:hypothetical protein
VAEEVKERDEEEGRRMMGVRMVLTNGVLETAEFKNVSARRNFPRQIKTSAHSTFAFAANRHLEEMRRRRGGGGQEQRRGGETFQQSPHALQSIG